MRRLSLRSLPALVFFENVQCLACKHALAYLPDVSEVGSLEQAGNDLWKALAPEAAGRQYRLCRNYSQEGVCNWAVPAEDSNPYCYSCRLTRVIPNLEHPGNREVWAALEVAKRRLMYSLMELGLPVVSKNDDPQNGLAFEFLADPDPADPNVTQSHDRTRRRRDHRQLLSRPTTPSVKNAASRCMSPIERCWATFGMRSAITIGTG